MSRKFSLVFLLVSIALLIAYTSALAHGHVQAGDYDLEIGFHNEPVVQGQPNALDLFVTNSKTGEKVSGLEDSLKTEVIFGASKKELRLEPQEDEAGAYTAYLIPTRAGDYTWHIFGKINDTPVDVSMTSSPDTFGSVEPQDTYNFPASAGNQGVSAQTALIVGIIAGVLGLAGLIVGSMALQAARRRAG